jgi:hypothetical protein
MTPQWLRTWTIKRRPSDYKRRPFGYKTRTVPLYFADCPSVLICFSPKVTSWAKVFFRTGLSETKGRSSVCHHQGKATVDIVVGLSDITVEVSDLIVGGLRTVRARAMDCSPMHNLVDAPYTAIWVVEGYKSHPNQPIHKIHWSISYIRVWYSLLSTSNTSTHQSLASATKEKTNQKATHVRWAICLVRIIESVCYLLWSFERGVLTHIHCKASKSPLSLWLAYRNFALLLTMKKKHSPTLTVGEREWVEKDLTFVDSSTRIRFLVNQTSVKQITLCHLCLLLVICLCSPSLSSLALFFVDITLCCFNLNSHFKKQLFARNNLCYFSS